MSLEIIKLREKNNLSQSELAERIGISRSSYIKFEKGEYDLKISEARKLANILGVSLEEVESGKYANYDKYKEMIQYLVKKFPKGLPKTKLAKMLYLADFAKFYHTYSSMSGMQYRRIQYGPVPDQYFRAIEELRDDGLIDYVEAPYLDKIMYNIKPTRGLDVVNEHLLEVDEKILLDDIFARWKSENTDTIVAFTHNQLPYSLCGKGEIIPYELIIQEDPENVY